MPLCCGEAKTIEGFHLADKFCSDFYQVKEEPTLIKSKAR